MGLGTRPGLASTRGQRGPASGLPRRTATKIVEKLVEVDPNGAIADGEYPRLFEHFSAVAYRLGVYTADDYADILEFLIERWPLEKLEGLARESRDAHEFVCGLAPRIR
ncbi:hypothetical protein SAY87_000182 [Trapa incisa]|uniref:Acyl-[acyl-carrier-protein] desaturase n=1 Tax=Trapa incisa TaxID=236973 RepID=A0AAN7GBP2_9MYRT|nr:hypothetical protein SAY87_000182 [Trapa incisa]